MTARVFFISLVGICVVFIFLTIMYLILSSFKIFIHDRRKKETDLKIEDQQQNQVKKEPKKPDLKPDKPELIQKDNISQKDNVSQEEIAAIMAALNNHNNDDLRGKKVIINKR